MQQYFPILKKCTLFRGFEGDDFENILLKMNLEVKYYEKNQEVRRQGIAVTEIGIVLSGAVYTAKFDFFGNRHILAEITEGNTFGESLAFAGATNSPISIIAAYDCAIGFISLNRLNELMSPSCVYSRQIAHNLITLLAERIMLLQIKTDILSQKTIREKLLLYFEYESKTAHSKTFRIHFSREELADFLSLNANALSRELGKMRDEGLLIFKKNRFTIKS